MKTIFITISDGEVSKNILRSKIFSILQKESNVVLFVHRNKLNYFQKEFSFPNVHIEILPGPTYSRLENWFSKIFLFSLHSESILVKINYSYYSGGTFFGRLGKLFLWSLGRFYIYRQLIRFLYNYIPDRSFFDYFKKHKPDLVFVTNLISNEDSRLLKSARLFGVKSVGMPKGWDNLTLKTFLSVSPDYLLVQTDLIKQDAVNFLDYPTDRIMVVGFPKFDTYTESPKKTREEFLLSMGLNPNKKTILYAGAGDQLAPHDEDILHMLLLAIERGDIVIPVQVLVRPHPKYIYHSELIKMSPFWILDRPGKVVGKEQSDFEFESKDIDHLVSSLAYCDLLIHTASTLGIEASIFDKPSITIAFDGDKQIRPELSVSRYYKYVHLERVVKTRGMKVAHNFNEFIKLINEYLQQPDLDRACRKLIVKENAYIIDGGASARVANFLVKLLKQ